MKKSRSVIAAFPRLVNVPAIARLKWVSQAGAPSISNPFRRATRYEHSLGAAHLLARLGATYDQQLASLFHDVGHFAFSHTVDYLLHNANEDTHELKPSSPIPSNAEVISATAGEIDYHVVADLVKNPPQWLRQVDKIDYTIRDLSNARMISTAEIVKILTALSFDGSTLFFMTTESAKLFCDLLQRSVERLYMNPISLYQHRVLADTLNFAIELGVIEFNDLSGIDAGVLARLDGHPLTAEMLRERLCAAPTEVVQTSFRMHSKRRLIEPFVKAGRSIVPLSEIDGSAWIGRRDHAISIAEGGVPAFRYRWVRRKLL